MKVIITIAVLLFATLELCSAGWERSYGGIGYDVAFSIAQTADDGFIVVGGMSSTGTDMNDKCWLFRH